MPDRAWRSRILRGAAAMAALAVALGVPSAATAQAASPSAVVARPGEVVRLRTAQWEYTGILSRVAGDTAVVHLAADSVRIPRDQVVRTQVQRGTRRSSGRVALFAVGGAATGFFSGAFFGAALGEMVSDDEFAGLSGALVGVAAGTVVGAVTGGIWGAQKRYPRWLDAVLAP